jgi:hypothetical protein
MEKAECEKIRDEFESLKNQQKDFNTVFELATKIGVYNNALRIKKQIEENSRALWEKIDPDEIYYRRKLAEKLNALCVRKEYDGIRAVSDRRGWYFIDKTGKHLTGELYAGVEDFKDGCAVCETLSGSYIVINKQGETIKPVNMSLVGMSEGLLALYDDERESGTFINVHGYKISDNKYKDLKAFSEGYAPVKIGDKWMFINRIGVSILTAKVFDDMRSFKEGCAAVKLGENWVFIGKDAKYRSENFAEVKDFSEGLAAVRKSTRWNFINKKGEKFFNDDILLAAGSFVEDRAQVKTDENAWFYIDKAGDFYGEGYVQCSDFKESIAVVKEKKDNLWYYIDKVGRKISTVGFLYAHDFHEGLAAVRELQLEKYYYIDKSGKRAFEGDFSGVGDFHDGLAEVSNGKDRYFIDKRGRRFK